MWIPFIMLFSLATFGLELLERNNMRTTESVNFTVGVALYLFILISLVVIIYPISFFPLTFIITSYVKKPKIKLVLFTFFGGLVGAFVFKLLFGAHFIEEYNLRMIRSIILFGVAGLLFALAEISIKRNIKFVELNAR